jgi:omega-6 fatty acid desaturase (delta-12 desaturase)
MATTVLTSISPQTSDTIGDAPGPTADGNAGTGTRSAREVLAATRPFAREQRWRSWWVFVTTFTIMGGLLVIAATAPWWGLQLLASMTAGMVLVRAFIIYHDYLHGAMLRRSWLARIVMFAFGYLMLTPARTWRSSHNHHHAHVGIAEAANSGTFPLMTVAMWRKASRWQRFVYRLSRNPVTIAGAYVTVFAFDLTLSPFLMQPLKKWDSALALALHAGVIAVLWTFLGLGVAFFAFVLPIALAGALGAYLFYVQHNYPGMAVIGADAWDNHRASLTTCSHLRVGRVMSWITGDIGLHHVHHLNLSIPFYRLREAMAAVPELQQPVTTTMRPWDVLACLRLKLWDERSGRMVGYRAARLDA